MTTVTPARRRRADATLHDLLDQATIADLAVTRLFREMRKLRARVAGLTARSVPSPRLTAKVEQLGRVLKATAPYLDDASYRVIRAMHDDCSSRVARLTARHMRNSDRQSLAGQTLAMIITAARGGVAMATSERTQYLAAQAVAADMVASALPTESNAKITAALAAHCVAASWRSNADMAADVAGAVTVSVPPDAPARTLSNL